MNHYYNDNDKYVAQWIRNLIDRGAIPKGYVDERSIKEIEPKDVEQYTQCHFFAGVAGWPEAFRLAGLSPKRSVWSGSPPCPSFSPAGNRKGFDDPRHLFPEWFRLIRECKPPIIFGEQTYSSDAILWLDLVSSELESEGYAIGKTVYGPHCIGSPHIRNRIWFTAVRVENCDGARFCRSHEELSEKYGGGEDVFVERSGDFDPVRWMADGSGEIYFKRTGREMGGTQGEGGGSGVGDSASSGANAGTTLDTDGLFSQGDEPGDGVEGEIERFGDIIAAARDAWGGVVWIRDAKGKARCFKPGIYPLAYGIPRSLGRVCAKNKKGEEMVVIPPRSGMIKGYGNAIVWQVAASFIKTTMEFLDETDT